jgi:eukaryotic-like serine/threonine-protein kinase
MKICPWCESGYPDELMQCPLHGGILSEIRDLKPGMLVRGTYRIQRKLSQGGMGHVYLAQQILLGELQVLKFLPRELSGDQNWTNRFLREVRTLRQIRHKNVVQAGNLEPAEDGTLFFSMEFIDGPDLMEFYRRAPKPFHVGLALELIRGVAEGLEAAHAVGVVHRDIKPENILLSRDGNRLVPKIADFGIVATHESSRLTQSGTTFMTPQFAAPEQWLGKPTRDLDGRTDFYALGGVLFEVLTGQCAFKAANYHGWAQQHLHAVPQAPSSLRPELKNWRGLDALVLRLLAKSPDRRPKNALELVAELDAIRYAGPETQTGATIASQSHPRSAVTEGLDSRRTNVGGLDEPITAGAPAREISTVPAGAPHLPRVRVVSVEETVQKEEEPQTASRQRTSADTADGWVLAKGRSRALLLSTAIAAVVLAVAFGIWRLARNPVDSLTLLNQHDAIFAVVYAPNGLNLASASRDHTVQFWDADNGRPLGTLDGDFTTIAYSPNGHSIATGLADHTIEIWDATSGVVLQTLQGHSDRVSAVAFVPGSNDLASAGWDGKVRLWDASTGALLRTFNGHTDRVLAIAVSPDGHTLASAGADKTIRLWNLQSQTAAGVLQGHTGTVNSLAFSPDGHTLVSASDDGTMRLWDPHAGQLKRTISAGGAPFLSVAFSPDGHWIASGSSDALVRVWSVASGKLLQTLKGHKGAVLSVAFNPFGYALASGSADKSIRLWDVAGIRE